MKYSLFATALLVAGATAHSDHYNANKRHAAYLARQVAAAAGATTTASSVSAAATTPAASGAASSAASSAASGAATTTAPATAAVPTSAAGGSSTLDGNSIPPLSVINSAMPLQGTVTMFTTFAAGATPPISGAPALPTIAIVPGNYPALDTVPPTNSSEVQGWLKEIASAKFPSIPKTTDGSCASDPALAANGSATGSCWWTCGGCLRETDISTCPDKLTWGVSYDDGPSPYTPKLLNYLNEKQLKATFFVVGSRVISRPQILQTEYMLGHEISVHTWSHTPLTSLTNEQIVAELGWTKKAIKDVTGLTPNTFRPPYGDLDDRVRAVAAAMGLTPIQWTGQGDSEFDTDDWKIPGGTATGQSSYDAFQKILGLASSLTTGFIVLEHDLYQQTVDMAVGYFIPLASNHTPTFKLESINQCLGHPLANSYIETASNSTTGSGSGTNGTTTATNSAKAGQATSSGGTTPSGAVALSLSRSMVVGALMGAVGVVFGVMAV